MPRTGLTAADLRANAIEFTLARMRRHGFDKVRLSDVAKDLGVSHTALYAHFADKDALLGAVTAQWLGETVALLAEICIATDAPLHKVRRWFVTLYRLKRERALADPELYRSFYIAAVRDKPFVGAHFAALHQQLVGLLADAAGTLNRDPPPQQADLLFAATTAFHHPQLVVEHAAENREELLNRVLDTVLRGLGAEPLLP